MVEFFIDDVGCHAICNSEAEALRVARKLGAEVVEHYPGSDMVFLTDGQRSVDLVEQAGYTVLGPEEDEDDD